MPLDPPLDPCRLTAADHVRLGRLRAESHRLVERSQASLGRAAVLLATLPFPWPPATDPAEGTPDLSAGASLGERAAELARDTRETIDRAAGQVARSRADMARTRELRQASRALRARVEGHRPPSAP